MQALLAYGASPNQATSNGSTPLLLACRYNDVRIAKLLLTSGLRAASLTAHDSEQRMTPMLWACLHCNAELVKLLCSSAQQLRVPAVVLARATNRFGQSPLMLACAACPARIGSSNAEKVWVTEQLCSGRTRLTPASCSFRQGIAAVIGPDAAVDALNAVVAVRPPEDGSERATDLDVSQDVDEDDKTRGALAAVASSAPTSRALTSRNTSRSIARARSECASLLRTSRSEFSRWSNPPTAQEVRRS